tara:strand:+ start:1919 stop:2398 length:480 start_codon:yes stop_codon:yes gene_type:complete
MGSFNGLLDAKFIPPRNWSLDAPLKFQSETLTSEERELLVECGIRVTKSTSRITVPKGYITDLASVPRICWSFIAPFDVARAAVVHDIMYEKINGAFKKGIIESKKEREIYRKIADRMFLEGMESAEPPVSKFKIKSAYYAVRIFGRFAINSSAPRKGI